MNDEFFQIFNNQTFNQESAVLKNRYSNPKILIVLLKREKKKLKLFVCVMVISSTL